MKKLDYIFTFSNKDRLKDTNWKRVSMIVAWTPITLGVWGNSKASKCQDCGKKILDDVSLPKNIDRVCNDCFHKRLNRRFFNE